MTRKLYGMASGTLKKLARSRGCCSECARFRAWPPDLSQLPQPLKAEGAAGIAAAGGAAAGACGRHGIRQNLRYQGRYVNGYNTCMEPGHQVRAFIRPLQAFTTRTNRGRGKQKCMSNFLNVESQMRTPEAKEKPTAIHWTEPLVT